MTNNVALINNCLVKWNKILESDRLSLFQGTKQCVLCSEYLYTNSFGPKVRDCSKCPLKEISKGCLEPDSNWRKYNKLYQELETQSIFSEFLQLDDVNLDYPAEMFESFVEYIEAMKSDLTECLEIAKKEGEND